MVVWPFVSNRTGGKSSFSSSKGTLKIKLSTDRSKRNQRSGYSNRVDTPLSNFRQKFSVNETGAGTELPISQRFDYPSPSARNL
jgi:hypothetical protein